MYLKDLPLFAATYEETPSGWMARITKPPGQIVEVIRDATLADVYLAVLVEQESRRPAAFLHGFSDGGPDKFAVIAQQFGWIDATLTLCDLPLITCVDATNDATA